MDDKSIINCTNYFPTDLVNNICQYLTFNEILTYKSTSKQIFNTDLPYYNKLFTKAIKRCLNLKYTLYKKLRIPGNNEIIIYDAGTYLIVKPKDTKLNLFN